MPTPPRELVTAARRATYAAFIGAGFAFASWASRIPQVRDRLGLSPAELGLVLLSVAAGSLVALPLAGAVVHRFTARRTVSAMALLLGGALATVAIGVPVGTAPVVVGLFVLGFSNGAWDVAMNVQGAAVERHLGRSIMPRFHAGYSIGTVVGALIGAGMVALDVPVTAHLLLAAAVVGIVVPLEVRHFLPDDDAESDTLPEATRKDGRPAASRGALRRWREPRTLLIGLLVLSFSLAEGAGNDWISVAMIDGYDTSAVVGTLGFAAFLAAMTAARWFGTTLLDRHGRVVVVRWLALLAATGVAVFVTGPSTAVAFVGLLLWGAGASLGFPVGMSAAADEPAAAAGRVSVVASIGYCAFLSGPPLIGLLGNEVTVLRALLVVVVLLMVAVGVAGAVRPLAATATVDAPGV